MPTGVISMHRKRKTTAVYSGLTIGGTPILLAQCLYRQRLNSSDISGYKALHPLGRSSLLKRDFLGYSRSDEEIALMRGLKQVFDPDQILNPDKLLPLADA